MFLSKLPSLDQPRKVFHNALKLESCHAAKTVATSDATSGNKFDLVLTLEFQWSYSAIK